MAMMLAELRELRQEVGHLKWRNSELEAQKVASTVDEEVPQSGYITPQAGEAHLDKAVPSNDTPSPSGPPTAAASGDAQVGAAPVGRVEVMTHAQDGGHETQDVAPSGVIGQELKAHIPHGAAAAADAPHGSVGNSGGRQDLEAVSAMLLPPTSLTLVGGHPSE